MNNEKLEGGKKGHVSKKAKPFLALLWSILSHATKADEKREVAVKETRIS